MLDFFFDGIRLCLLGFIFYSIFSREFSTLFFIVVFIAVLIGVFEVLTIGARGDQKQRNRKKNQ